MTSEATTKQEVETQDSIWLKGIFRPIMVALLVTCLAAGFVAVAQSASPGWGRGIALPFFALVSVESVYTTLWLASSTQRDRRTTRFYAGEVFLLLLAARIVAFFIKGEWPNGAILAQWLRSPLSFLDGTTTFLWFLTLLVWGESTLMMRTLERMGLKPDELAMKPLLPARGMDWNEVRARHPSRSALLARFSAHWLWGGLLLAFCAGLSRVELTPSSGQLMGLRHLGLTPLLQAALVIYFLGGLLLVSQGHLAVLRVRWRYEGTPTDPNVVRRWGWLGVGVLAVIGLIAALLPFGSSFILARALVAVINVMMQIAYVALLLLFTLFGLLVSFIHFGQTAEQGGRAERIPPPVPETMSKGVHLPDWLGGAILWLLMGGIILYSLIAYLNERGVRLDVRHLRRLWAWLQTWWSFWRRRAEQVGRRVGEILTLRRPAQGGIIQTPWRFLSLRRLDTRGRVRYFYLAMVRRASEHGLPRHPAETPHEYEGNLEAGWPELEAEITSLTQAFIDARYTTHELGPEDAKRAQELWKRVRSFLRQRDRQDSGDRADSQTAS
ncbi:MAG: DUF4129 domain-containing protein [Anaerolineae bacterium]|nr:DUF4129 domain-containing protein [Anaerolineae bacterium]